jgi:hypothetical protein
MHRVFSAVRGFLVLSILLSAGLSSPAMAQEVRYKWLDLSFMAQSSDLAGSALTPVPDQFVDINTSDGNGIRFRGSIGTWHNMYLFMDYGSADIDVSAFVVSPLVPLGQTAVDEFDFTTIRGGIGLKYTIGNATDVYGEITYDSADFDFGSFALENFDTGDKDLGGALGIRRMMNDDIEVRAHARYTNVGDVDLNTLYFDADVLYGVGFGWQVVRGFSIVGDYESGELSSWSIGFRLDLDLSAATHR